jgi:tRNA (cmo5U34)-methyltransferase
MNRLAYYNSYLRLKYPEASLTLLDISDEMLAQARNRFRDDRNVHYMTADLKELAAYDFKGEFDVVISSLSIHHLTHPDKISLFHTIYKLLSDDGIFVNADQVSGSSAYFDNRYKAQWEDMIRRSGLSSAVIESAIERRKLDINASVEDQLEWLKNAGFSEVDCIYKYHEFAIFFSRKDTTPRVAI